MIENNPDLTHTLVAERQAQLRNDGRRIPNGRTNVVRIALGTTLIRLGQRVAGQYVTPGAPATPPRLATR